MEDEQNDSIFEVMHQYNDYNAILRKINNSLTEDVEKFILDGKEVLCQYETDSNLQIYIKKIADVFQLIVR